MASVEFEAWLAATENQQIDVAARLGISRASVSYYARGQRIPKLEPARKIERLTRGTVPVPDWRVPAGAEKNASGPRGPNMRAANGVVRAATKRARKMIKRAVKRRKKPRSGSPGSR